ncbi:hypothetical protein DL764_004183 [Monosporascus ibericus]|uniref:Uncharacterized protein n=1 Tax=Monosporascus ibericus TaxID=155417 RepID=A0A4Q4TH54_9PEZI|nr:hypothetical protein DL764_004183 [Monosporascus ibericus]
MGLHEHQSVTCELTQTPSITFGMLGPTYGLRLRDCALVILFFSLLTAAIPVYLGTLGPKTGLRQMIQARYSFGRYLVSVPVILNLATLTGFCVITCVVGGQCLSAIRDGSVSEAVGIVVIGLLALFISFCGYDVLHQYERFAYIPALICFAIVAGCGGSHLKEQADAPPTTAKAVLSFGMIIASYMIPYAALASDFTTYLNPKFPSVIPVSIRATTDFFLNLENFIAMIAYWSAAFVAVVIIEHVVFRRGRYETYDHDAWNSTSRLSLGIAALTSATLSFVLVIPCMNQVWHNGPIAVKTADIGFEMAFAVTAFLYFPLRALEKRYTGRPVDGCTICDEFLDRFQDPRIRDRRSSAASQFQWRKATLLKDQVSIGSSADEYFDEADLTGLGRPLQKCTKIAIGKLVDALVTSASGDRELDFG